MQRTTNSIKHFLLAAVLLIVFTAGAQKTSDNAKTITDRMQTSLSLDSFQYKKVYAVNLDFITKAAGAKAAGGGKMAMFKKLKSADEDRDKALKNILTKEQFDSFKDTKKENRAKMKEMMKEKKG